MKPFFTLLLVFGTLFCKAQSCDTFNVTGHTVPVFGIIQTYPTVDTECWYWNRADVQNYVTVGIAYAAPIIGYGAFSSTTVALIPSSKVQTGSQIAVQNMTAGNYVWVPSNLVSSTGFTVYDKASGSDSIIYWIWNHK